MEIYVQIDSDGNVLQFSYHDVDDETTYDNYHNLTV